MSSPSKKVFVGNLNYVTNEDDLKEAFSKAGKVVDAKVVRRGSRSKGYGFVEFETEEEAKKAVELLDKFDLNERQINVQSSTSTGTKVGNREGGSGGGYRDGGYRDGGYRDGGYRDGGYRDGGYRDDNRDGGFRRPFRPQFRNYNSYSRGPMNRGRKMYFLRNNYDDNGPRRRNNGRPPVRRSYNTKPQRNTITEKIESKTTIFVANLPFSVDDEGLIELFSKCGPIRTAHVVKNKGRSKGFGFVEFENQEGQVKALKDMDNHPVPYKNGEQKALSVKVAMSELEKKEPIQETETTV